MPLALRIRLILFRLKTPISVIVMLLLAAVITLGLIRATEWLTVTNR
ncbi:MAG TPA: hypothetical protein VFV95_12125 [Vicinamibacterales bacterium]|nr:hypothetical protein [Vicinamibacterales bacterium]